MSAPQYNVRTEANVATGTSLIYILGVKAHANSGLILSEASVFFDGATAGATPVLVELCYCTWATNSPGTNSTSNTPQQKNGRVMTAGFTSGENWTAAPTVVTMLDVWRIHPQAGVWVPLPLGTEYDCALAEGFVMRVTAAATVNARARFTVSRA